jgi:putative transposase
MTRPLRIELPGGWYHVVDRGLERSKIFLDERSNRHFLKLLSQLPTRFGVKVHSYVLMVNHYHLQLETPRANLSQAIQWLNVSYSSWYNRLNRRSGPLFQGRFKAILHEPETGLAINRYIHLNPVRISILGGHENRGEPREGPSREVIKARVAALCYPWSSYGVYVGKVRNPGWVTTEAIYGFFGDRTERSLRSAYRRQLEERAALGHWETDCKDQVRATVLLGSEEFVTRLTKCFTGNRNEQTGLRQAERARLVWPEICRAISATWKAEWTQLAGARGNGALPAAWYVGRQFGGMRLTELGQAAGGVAYPAVSIALSRFEKRLKVDRALQRKIQSVRELLNV